MRVAIGTAAGFLAGVLLVAILGGARPAGPTATVTVTAPAAGGSGPGATVITKAVVPDVVGQPLELALERVARAGFEADVEGGGLFGVVDESNWEVANQEPREGFLEQGSSIRLDVERR